jgi:O-antigen/teichoic acid export membrane protein
MRDRLRQFAAAIQLGDLPIRARWSFADQILVSGVNFLTTVLLVRALGLQEFGTYSMVMIGVQFLAGLQMAGILAPMMSLFDQRGSVPAPAYLATILIHQAALIAALATAVLIAVAFAGTAVPKSINVTLACGLVVATQVQDLARRFFYVTERPALAFLSDIIAYGCRLAALALLAFHEGLTISLTWIVVIAACIAALLPFVPDAARARATSQDIKTVTKRHKGIAGWLVANNFVGWFGDAGFVLFMIGGLVGPAELGAVWAVFSIVLVVNLLLQSIENFVPSAATQTLVKGGGAALRNYIDRMSVLGVVLILSTVAVLMLLADPLMNLVFGRTFPDQLWILAILGVNQALVHVTMVAIAGLRALTGVRQLFLAQAIASAASLALVWPMTAAWGVIGALLTLLLVRLVLTVQLVALLRKGTQRV